jgi:hypothetical protein
MAPKKPTVTSSSTRSARVKGGSNPVVTKGTANTRAARTSLGPTSPQRPMASGGTKGPLQGGTRSPSLKAEAKPAAKPSGQFKAPSVPKPGTATKPQGTPQARAWFEQNKPSARLGKQLNAQQVANINKVRQGLAPIAGIASLAGGARNLAVNAVTDVVKPRPTAAGTLSAQGTVSKFANARDKAMAKAKGIKGSPVLGAKKVGSGGGKLGAIAQAFDKSFASARKAGKATFMFRGKKYTTEMA